MSLSKLDYRNILRCVSGSDKMSKECQIEKTSEACRKYYKTLNVRALSDEFYKVCTGTCVIHSYAEYIARARISVFTMRYINELL